jgi:[ribosomal protein S18]-alanine N-acetyltransferase
MYYFVERMTEDDIPAVQEIERSSFTTPWSTNTYRQEIRNQSSRYLVVRSSATIPPPRNERPISNHAWWRSLLPAFLRRATPIEEQPSYRIVGYGGVWLSVDEGHITTIAIAPAYRGCGIGELMLNHLIDHALDLMAERITLEVRLSNVIAQQLYLKYGFEPVGKRPRYYTDNGEDALLMTTPLIRDSTFQERTKQLREKLYERLRRDAEQPPPQLAQVS